MRRRGFKPAKRWHAIWREEHGKAFIVAQITEAEKALWIRDALIKAQQQGITKRQFVKALAPALQAAGWAPIGRGGDIPTRLRRIFDINMRVSHAAGHWARGQRVKKLLPYLVYAIGPSKNHREQHLGWRGVCLPVDDPWWDTHYPPNGWGCKCWVRQISKRRRDDGVAAGKLDGRRPAAKMRTLPDPRNRRRKIQVPEGIDAGWDYNPGKNSWRGVSAAAMRTTARLAEIGDGRPAAALARMIVGAPGFKAYATLKKQTDEAIIGMPVGILRRDQGGAIGSVLALPPERVRHLHHRFGNEDKVRGYLAVQIVLDAPELIRRQEDGRWIAARRIRTVIDGKAKVRWWIAVWGKDGEREARGEGRGMRLITLYPNRWGHVKNNFKSELQKAHGDKWKTEPPLPDAPPEFVWVEKKK